MLDTATRRKLESLHQIPTIPFVISEVMSAVDNTNLSAAALASIIEKDQSLTARVLRVANSPFYGFQRKISTIDLAVVVLGLNSIKEIVLSLVIQRFFLSVRQNIFDLNAFWRYSVFCGACSRYLARKLGYRIAGEAFVAGLMHDIGILIIVEHFSRAFIEIRKLQRLSFFSMVNAEKVVLKSTHADIGAWIAEKWNIPAKICKTISNHHFMYDDLKAVYEKEAKSGKSKNPFDSNIMDSDLGLTAIVSLSELFAQDMGFKTWAEDSKNPPLFVPPELIARLRSHDILDPKSVYDLLKQEILEEFNKASVLSEMATRPLYR